MALASVPGVVVIKYLGSKRLLAPALGDIAVAVAASTALDAFTGTTRVAQEFKRRGLHVTAVDTASYSEVLARCFVATDARVVDRTSVRALLAELESLPGRRGYVTRTFCEQARFFQPKNGLRIDAMRDRLAALDPDDPLFAVAMAALLLAADRVDSTTGLQMAYLKQWADRSHNDIQLRVPDLIDGPGVAIAGDVMAVAADMAHVDIAYLDPPYNQHRYFTNYHVWETLVRWDSPETYGVARKRADSRDATTRTAFDGKRTMPVALRRLLDEVRADVVVVSHSDESWCAPAEIMEWLADRHEDVRALAFDNARYVGAQIGIHDPSGRKVGAVSHTRNTEYVLVAGDRDRVAAAAAAVAEHPRRVGERVTS